MKIKVSDYIAEKLVEAGIQHLFMVTGGGAMHLNNSLGKNPGLQCIFNHHEQASAIAAESYARLTGKIAALCVTSGPGGTNAITGVYGAYVDSIPMLIISGQIRYDTHVLSTGLPLRQLGDQEIDIIRMVPGITKYAVMVTHAEEIRYHVEKALYLAKAGRPGPCWLDIPMNIQGAMVDPEQLKAYDPKEDLEEAPIPEPKLIREIIDRIRSAKRPVLFAGSGIRLSGAHADFLKLVEALNIPVVTAWNAHDNIPDDHPLYCGRPGTVGDRAGNFIVQNSDLLFVLGCRLNIRQIGYSWQTFAREAYKIIVDIDPAELKKPTLKPDLPIHANVSVLMKEILKELKGQKLSAKEEWIHWCLARKELYPVVLKEYWKNKGLINPSCFMQKLGEHLPEGQITVTGDGTACVCAFQAMKIKKGQRLYTNSGCAAMGYDLPAAIGACFGSGKQKIICLAGDGSLQMNIQELQTVAHHKLPIKIFVLN
ncbi:MAG: thiamine pyrophosphate-binding protein, partial [bacterium]|nr:thiamine pyrophosphate-binding protein [bacterium]